MNSDNVLKSTILSIFFIVSSINAFSQTINTPENFPDPNFRAVVEEFMGVEEGGEFTAFEAAEMIGDFDCSGQDILDLTGIEFLTGIDELHCANNELTSLDLPKNTALTGLDCSMNQLTSLDISNNSALEWLDCWENQLTELDVSQNTDLAALWCHGNELTILDVSNNPDLLSLVCYENQLTSLDVSNNPILLELACSRNQLTHLDVSNNPVLIHLSCFDNQLTSLAGIVVNESIGKEGLAGRS